MAAGAVSRTSGTEGMEGNVHASRAWKGDKDVYRTLPVLRFFLPGTSQLQQFSLFAFRSSPNR